MDGDGAGALFGKIARQQTAEVFRAAGDENGFTSDAVIGHGQNLFGA
ncbi:UNVERIFIED_ORG: hypothetical protein J2W85_005845 [Ensifer adhaerens]|nr:hypothetical protein [Ensifer adhaerens]